MVFFERGCAINKGMFLDDEDKVFALWYGWSG
jgi:hypothetical protein